MKIEIRKKTNNLMHSGMNLSQTAPPDKYIIIPVNAQF